MRFRAVLCVYPLVFPPPPLVSWFCILCFAFLVFVRLFPLSPSFSSVFPLLFLPCSSSSVLPLPPSPPSPPPSLLFYLCYRSPCFPSPFFPFSSLCISSLVSSSVLPLLSPSPFTPLSPLLPLASAKHHPATTKGIGVTRGSAHRRKNSITS